MAGDYMPVWISCIQTIGESPDSSAQILEML